MVSSNLDLCEPCHDDIEQVLKFKIDTMKKVKAGILKEGD